MSATAGAGMGIEQLPEGQVNVRGVSVPIGRPWEFTPPKERPA